MKRIYLQLEELDIETFVVTPPADPFADGVLMHIKPVRTENSTCEHFYSCAMSCTCLCD